VGMLAGCGDDAWRRLLGRVVVMTMEAIFIYLTLSGYALREETANVLQALEKGSGNAVSVNRPQPVPKHVVKVQLPGMTSKEGKTFTYWENAVEAFAANPSMKFGRSGQKLFLKYMPMSKTKKTLINNRMAWGMAEYLIGNRVNREAKVAKLLDEGMTKWIDNQKTKKNNAKQNADYAGCTFNMIELAEFTMGKEWNAENMLASVAKVFLDPAASGKTCKIVDAVGQFLNSLPGRQLLGNEPGEDAADEAADAESEDNSHSALMELSSSSMMESEQEWVMYLVGGIIAVVVFIFWCANYCHDTFGPSGRSFLELSDHGKQQNFSELMLAANLTLRSP